MKAPDRSLITDFEVDDVTGFFCMELGRFTYKYSANYSKELAKAKAGNCSYKNECIIYKRTMERFIKKVHNMRTLQREYFRTRDKETLKQAKNAESEVDLWLKNHERKERREPTLF